MTRTDFLNECFEKIDTIVIQKSSFYLALKVMREKELVVTIDYMNKHIVFYINDKVNTHGFFDDDELLYPIILNFFQFASPPKKLYKELKKGERK